MLCEKLKVGYEFLREHNCPVELANQHFNRCYCNLCYPKNRNDTVLYGGKVYVVPRGWVRFGVHVDHVQANYLNLWNWCSCFHGTSIEKAKSIIEHRMLLLPGETTMDGKKIEICKGHVPGQYYFFTTPTIKYAELNIYADTYLFTSPTDRRKYNVKVVLQCKQKAGTFMVQSETVAATQRICPYIPNDQLEWKSDSRASIIPYGILLLITSQDEPVESHDKIKCPKCQCINRVTSKQCNKDQAVTVTCANRECLNKFCLVICRNCSSININYSKVFVCQNDTCSKRYEHLLQRRRKQNTK